ncbi:MAG: hypothetical protein FWC98_02905 [Bacteroidales bacterium]|nr:hypothetical protein [Bacteroidales bacterium]
MKKIISVSKRKIVKFVKFTRELAIITIGVGIALFAGDLLSNRNTKQDLRAHLELVKLEFYGNIPLLRQNLDFFTREIDYACFVMRNVNNPNAVDSLSYFNRIYSSITWYDLHLDAIDLFFSSGRAHLIRDKKLLLGLASLNSRSHFLEDRASRYNSDKDSEGRRFRLHPQTTGLPFQNFYIQHRSDLKIIKRNINNLLASLEEALEILENLRL